MVYLFCVVFGGVLIGAVVTPLFRKDDSLESAIIEETEWDLLQRKKEVVLSNIQDLDTLIRREINVRRNRTEASPLTCSACGSANPITNKFCAECGAKLKS